MEALLGRRRHQPVHRRHRLGVAGIMANGTPEQIGGEWVPQCFGTPEKLMMSPFCVSEPDAGSDVSRCAPRPVYDRGQGTSGSPTARRRSPTAASPTSRVNRRLGRPRPRQSRTRPSFIVPPGTPGLSQGHQSSRSTASGPATPPRSSWTTAASRAPACSAARRSLDERSPGPARARSSKVQAAMATFEATSARRSAPGRQPLRRLRVRPRGTPRSAASSASLSSRTSRSPSCSPT